MAGQNYMLGFPGGSDGKESACSAGHPGSIPGSGRSPGEGNGNLLQYSCMENPMDRGAWWAQSMGLQRVGHDRVTNTSTSWYTAKSYGRLQSILFSDLLKSFHIPFCLMF